MPGRRVTIRPTHFERILPRVSDFAGGFAKRRTEDRDGYRAEFYVLVIGILVNCMFVAGCIMFFEIWPPAVYETGLWFFFVASILNAGLSAYAIWELRMMNKQVDPDDNLGSRDEFLEHILYMGCGVAYAVGSVLWMPWIYQDKWNSIRGHSAAAWCFIFGSVGLVLASIWNAFGLVEESAKRRPRLRDPGNKVEVLCRRLASIALCCTAVGGSLFVAGSFLFRPGFENDCTNLDPLPLGQVRLSQPSVRYRWRFRGWEQDIPILEPYMFMSQAQETPERTHNEENETLWSSFLALVDGAGDDARPALRRDAAAQQTKKGADQANATRSVLLQSVKPHKTALPTVRPKASLHSRICVDIVKQGTWIYLWGSVAFLAQSLISMLCSVILQRYSLPASSASASESYTESYGSAEPYSSVNKVA